MPLRVFTELEDRKQGLRDERRIVKRRELHEPDSIGEATQQVCCHLQSQAGLPRAAGTGQRNQTMVCDQLLELVHLFFTSNEGRQLRGEIVVGRLQSFERREFGRQVGRRELIELLRVQDIL